MPLNRPNQTEPDRLKCVWYVYYLMIVAEKCTVMLRLQVHKTKSANQAQVSSETAFI